LFIIFEMVDFAERLKELRTEKGLTMKQLAEAVKVTEVAISNWEGRKRIPNINYAVVIAKFFNVTVGYLVGVEN